MTLEFLDPVIHMLPEVKRPPHPPAFNKRILWVVAAIVIFFVMGQVTPYGALTEDQLRGLQTTDPELYQQLVARFSYIQNLEIILASKIGSIATLGIGPIVMASIILQLLSGAEIINIEKERYQGVQKLFAMAFCFFEAAVYVYTGFIPTAPTGISLLPIGMLAGFFELNKMLVLLQISLGSIVLLYLDEVVSKWGFGSGIGLFIVAGVSQSIIWRAIGIAFLKDGAGNLVTQPVGILITFFNDIMVSGMINFDTIMPILFTLAVFLIVVYVEAMRIEIPLTLGRIRGVGGRYPLKFLYVSNIPVILAAALFANIQLFANMFANAGMPLLGTFGAQGTPLAELVLSTNLNELTIPVAYLVRAPYGIIGTQQAINTYLLNPTYTVLGILPLELVHLVIYSLILILFCIVFGSFWVETTNMGPSAVADQLQKVGFSVPGFRRDKRVIEHVLRRYIPTITLLGAASVGILAAGADITGALGTGTGILLTVGILYKLYEELASSQLMELHPALKNFFG